LLYKIHKAKSALEKALNRTPNEEELAEVLEMHVSEIYTILRSEGSYISLGSSVSNEDTTTLEDKLENNNFPDTDN
jgi:DNA-directed RNA polymerase sigma subunit (sigma70/sigma32)